MPVKSFICLCCNKHFTRKGHLEKHEGTHRCLLNQERRTGSGRKRKASGGKRKEGESIGLTDAGEAFGLTDASRRRPCDLNVNFDSHNFHKALSEERVDDFVEYLQDNLRFCQNSEGNVVSIVPYDSSYVPRDIDAMAQAIREQIALEGHREGCVPATWRIFAAALGTCFFFTAAAAHVVGIPDLSQEYEAALVQRFVDSRRACAHICNSAITICSIKSLLHIKGKNKIFKAASELAATVINAARIVYDSFRSRKHTQPANTFLRSVAVKGAPYLSYTQNMVCCLWQYGHLPPLPCFAECNSERVLLPSLQSGSRKGMEAILLDAHGRLSGPTLRICIEKLGRLVTTRWKRRGSLIEEPFADRAIARERSISHQLCSWSKDKFGTMVRPIRTITLGQGA
jgi:hypothetical protein